MTKLELMTVVRSLKKLHRAGRPDLAEEVLDEIIAEADGERSIIIKNRPSETSDD